MCDKINVAIFISKECTGSFFYVKVLIYTAGNLGWARKVKLTNKLAPFVDYSRKEVTV